MSNLHIPINREWFNLIEAGIKREEYRDIKPFWLPRLLASKDNSPFDFGDIKWMIAECIKNNSDSPPCLESALNRLDIDLGIRWYDTVTFVVGMPKKGTQEAADKTLVFRFMGTEIGYAKEGIGKELVGDRLVFVIKFEDL